MVPQHADKDSDGTNAPERFPLLRYFVSTTLLVTIAIAIALAALLVRRADKDFEDIRTTRGAAEAGYVAELFYHDILGPVQQQGATVLLADVIGAREMDAFTSRTTLGLDILSLTFMNVDGAILWSSDSRSNGMYQLDEELHATVVDQGTAAAALHRRVADTSGEDRSVDLVRTLFPLRDVRPNAPEEGQLVGILAVDQDVTEDLARARSESQLLSGVTCA